MAGGAAMSTADPRPAPSLVRYHRSGGLRPSDDETLEVAEDGTFRAWRTVAGPRIGAFGGVMPDDALSSLGALVEGCRRAGPIRVPVPRDGASERIEIDGDAGPTGDLGGGAEPAGPWGPLARRVRELLDAATDAPVGALELAEADGVLTLAWLGEARSGGADAAGLRLEVDLPAAKLELVRLGPDGVPVGRWAPHAFEGAVDTRAETGPGWRMELTRLPETGLMAGEWLQVWLRAPVRPADGVVRVARWFLAVPGPA
jgi:hypothetical protein